MQSIRSLVLVFLVVGLTSCTEPGETTGMGAAAGGAIGAGLGAIVGSQVGSAGAGLVIGAASGAAAGGLVGNKLEAQDQALRTQDEAIERQEQMVASHRRQLDELKRVHDGGSSGAASRAMGSAGAGRSRVAAGAIGYSYPGSSLKLSAEQRRRLARGERIESDTTRGSFRSPTTVSRSSLASRTNTRLAAIAPRKTASTVAKSSPPKPRMEIDRTSSKAAQIEEQAVEVAEDSTVAASTSFTSPSNEAIPALPAEIEASKDAGATQEVAAIKDAPIENKVNPAPSNSDGIGEKDLVARVVEPSVEKPMVSEECQRAAGEVEKASASKEVADKLFHYRRALRLCPNDPQYHIGLAQVYKSLERTSDAEFEYREALRINPELSEAREGLSSLH